MGVRLQLFKALTEVEHILDFNEVQWDQGGCCLADEDNINFLEILNCRLIILGICKCNQMICDIIKMPPHWFFNLKIPYILYIPLHHNTYGTYRAYCTYTVVCMAHTVHTVRTSRTVHIPYILYGTYVRYIPSVRCARYILYITYHKIKYFLYKCIDKFAEHSSCGPIVGPKWENSASKRSGECTWIVSRRYGKINA